MRRTIVAAFALASAIPLAGCNTPDDYNAGRGALIGGTSGALIGGLATGRPGGALIGGAIGAASGAVLGAASTPRPVVMAPPPPGPPGPPCARWGDDGYGNTICLKLAQY